MKRRIPHARRWLPTILVLLLALSACSLPGGSGSKSPTTPPLTKNTPTISAATSIQLGVQPCPDAVKAPAHWDTIVDLTSSQKVEGIICGYLMGVPSLQAVVKMRSAGNDQLLDIAVYTAITSTHPSRIFSLKGLRDGEVNVSNYNTLLTMQIDLNARQIQHDLYREFKWSDSAGTLAQVPFVGLYPDMTRYQAEVAQGEVNTGQASEPWRLSAVTTAQNFAEFELGWELAAPTTVVSGGGTHDAQAVILVMNPSEGNATIKLSLSRLELNTNGGIWEVTGVATDGLAIASPQNAQQLTSPVQVTGGNTAFAGKPATIMILDQDHTQMSQALSVGGKTQFSASVSYTSNFSGETEEGILALYTYSGNQVIVGATMMKVLLSA